MSFFTKQTTQKSLIKSGDEEYLARLTVKRMPDKYLQLSGKKNAGERGKSKKWIIVLVGVMLFVIGSVVAVLFLASPQQALKPKTAGSKEPKKSGLVVQNVNTNTNASTNSNVNLNTNSSINTNAAPPVNQNQNVNAVPVNINVNTNTSTPPPSEKILILLAPDADTDGLSDREEDLYLTHLRTSDTDGDGFGDGAEVLQLYDPASGSGKKLRDSNAITIYKDTRSNAEFLSPKSWKQAGSDLPISFLDISGAKVTFLSVELGTMKFEEWYKIQQGAIEFALLVPYMKEGFEGYQASDQLIYLLQGSKVFVFNYVLDSSNTLHFLTTFRMMIKSFTVTQTSS